MDFTNFACNVCASVSFLRAALLYLVSVQNKKSVLKLINVDAQGKKTQ